MRLEKEFLIRQHKRKLICQSIWDQNNISQIFTPQSPTLFAPPRRCRHWSGPPWMQLHPPETTHEVILISKVTLKRMRNHALTFNRDQLYFTQIQLRIFSERLFKISTIKSRGEMWERNEYCVVVFSRFWRTTWIWSFPLCGSHLFKLNIFASMQCEVKLFHYGNL